MNLELENVVYLHDSMLNRLNANAACFQAQPSSRINQTTLMYMQLN